MGEASAVGLDVLESVVHESARAARVKLNAINELHCSERDSTDRGAGGDLDGALTHDERSKRLAAPKP